MSEKLSPAVADLLAAIREALEGMADWRVVAVTVAVDRAWAGDDDPGAAADWLREFLAQREATRPLYPELADDLKRAGEQAARHKAGLA